MKTKSLEERLVPILTEVIYSEDVDKTCKILLKLIKSELDNRDKEWIEAVGGLEDVFDKNNFPNTSAFIRNQLRLEIKEKMEKK